MSTTGKILAKFAKNNQELASSGLEAVENLARTVNDFQTQVAEGIPFELIGDMIAATLADMIPGPAKKMINMAAFFTMLISFMVALLFGRKVLMSFFSKRTPYEDDE